MSVRHLSLVRLAADESREQQKPNKEERRRWRTEIPNIVFQLSLSVYGLALYALVRKVAGEHGSCFLNTDSLAKKCGMSTGSVSKAKAELTKPRHELGGKSLCKIVPRSPLESKGRRYQNATSRKDCIGRGRRGDCIKIVDVWDENFFCFSSRARLAVEREDGSE